MSFVSQNNSAGRSSVCPIRSYSLHSGDPAFTVIVPTYNEAATVAEVLQQITLLPFDKEIIVVDDGSTDETNAVLSRWANVSRVTLLHHSYNRGKGAAIRTALERARGQYTIIQDADLECDPSDLTKLIEPILAGESQVVYGSRYLASSVRPRRPIMLRLGVKLLNWTVRLLYGVRITDEATCYKLFPTVILRTMNLECSRFDFCPEVTAKACRMKLYIKELPIQYFPRSIQAGKKLRFIDGLQALLTLWRFRHWLPVTQPPHNVEILVRQDHGHASYQRTTEPGS